MRGIILFAHGARDPRWAEPFERTAALLRSLRPDRQVCTAYLEFLNPDLDTAGRALAKSGCSVVDVLPMFLGAGGHVRKDLPKKLDALRAAFPDVRWELHRAIGESAELLSAMAEIGAALPDVAPENNA
jgi:sirohydrochlorin cobaltochelatase